MDFALDDELETLRRVTAEFVARDVAPRAARRDREAAFPDEEWARAGELGFCGLMIPESYGGNPVGALGAAIVYEEIAAASPALCVSLSVHNSLVSAALVEYAAPALKDAFLPRVATGELLGSYALTEAQAGSDAAAIRTRAVKTDDGYRISGRKMFVTSGAHAGIYVVFAVTDPEARTSSRISAFVVERDRPGVNVVRKEKKLGLRASEIVELELADVPVPEDHRLSHEGSGFGIAMSLLSGGRIGIGAQAVGIGRGAFERARRYARERRQFGQAIAGFEAIQWKLVDMSTQLDAARLLVHRAAWLRDHNLAHTREASQAKLFASEAAFAIADAAVQVHGGYGYLEEYEVERYLRDARATTLYEGTSEIQRLVIARQLLAEQD